MEEDPEKIIQESNEKLYDKLINLKNPKKFYLTNPHTKKDGLTSYVSYDLKGELIPDASQYSNEENTRRYSDFYSLREKLLINFPGIYIPGIPPKKMIGNIEEKFIELRNRLLNIFCYKLSSIDYLLNSNEVKCFLDNKFPSKLIEKIKKENYEEIYIKYKNSFKRYYNSYDLILGKGKLVEYKLILQKFKNNLKILLEIISSSLIKKENELNSYVNILKNFELYEEILEIKNGVFSNKDNGEIIQVKSFILDLKKDLKNPYIETTNWLHAQILDIDSIEEAMNNLKEMNANHEKLFKKQSELKASIKDTKSGIKNFKTLFLSEDKVINDLESKKSKVDNELKYIQEIIKLAHFNLECFLENYQTEIVKEYRRHITLFFLLHKKNNYLINELFSRLINIIKDNKEMKNNKEENNNEDKLE